MIVMEKNDLFIKAVRQYLNLKPDNYYCDEPESVLDHGGDCWCVSNMCRWFYNRCVKDTLGEKNERL